jgi:acetylornithine/succinyldiaminopimelate/putrescine aminotransferase/predicted amino acid dehydrogenase
MASMEICRGNGVRAASTSGDDVMDVASAGLHPDEAVGDSFGREVAGGCGQHKPHLQELLRAIGLDVCYHRARGDHLHYLDGLGREVEVLDLVGGFGTLLFGHNHPDLTQAAIEFLSSASCNHVQGSISRLAANLASELSRRAGGDYCVTFGNSGSEAVEAAMKHAMLETGGQTFLALDGAFHGKTLGALQLTSNRTFRKSFAGRGMRVVRVARNDIEQLERVFADIRRPAGFFFEPIQGEGGVRPVRREFLKRAASLCAERGIPLIADECQTGLGRTGAFLASQELGVRPDYIILAKALGGGLAKISALLVERRRYCAEFDLLHSSTFANDGLSCAIGLKVLSMLDQRLLDGCREKGKWLKSRLRALKAKYPTVIADVRGAGMMLGVEFRKASARQSFLLRFLAANDLLGLLAAANLLHVHQIRVAPTLSDPWTLRVQPSALIQYEELERFVDALDDICSQLQCEDVASLTKFLGEGRAAPGRFPSIWPSRSKCLAFRRPVRRAAAQGRSTRRVAWLFHLTDADDLPYLEPGLQELASEERQAFLNRVAPFVRPVVMDPVEIHSASGECADLCPLLLPVTSRWLKFHFERRRFRELRALVQLGVDVASGLGCEIVSLGQFTSIVTRHGRSVSPRGMNVTSGNAFSAALAVNAVRHAQAQVGMATADCTLAIVGATGDIGRVCAEILAPEFRRALVVGSGRRGSESRLKQIAQQVGAEWSCDLTAVRAANVVVCATNSVDLPLGVEHLARGTIVCDVSMPSTVDASSVCQRPDLVFIRGGVVRLPFGERLGIPGLPLPTGCAHGCLAEGVLLAYEGTPEMSYVGRASVPRVKRMEVIARRHGFMPAEYETLPPVIPMTSSSDHVPNYHRRFA